MISRALVSRMTNCWALQLNKKVYAVLPAHVAVYEVDGKWTRSHFLDDLNQLSWKVPFDYTDKRSVETDFAWAILNEDKDDDSLQVSLTNIDYPKDATFYFKQPYDSRGNMTNVPTLGAMKGLLYPSPASSMLECLGTGFRGMSGSLERNASVCTVIVIVSNS